MGFYRGLFGGTVAGLVLAVTIFSGVLLGGLLLLEGGGPSPVHPLERNISIHQPAVPLRPSDVTTRGKNPNRHCKPKPFPHDCRRPSSG
jgi:hypothetical protein